MGEDENWLHHDHVAFEVLLEDCRDAAEAEDWRDVKRLFNELVSNLKLHMRIEEEALYPAYEQAMGTTEGPTRSLRTDHNEIVRLLHDLHFVLGTNDSAHFVDSLAPLEAVMERHHEKEEEIFLPMASQLLREQREEILKRLATVASGEGKRVWKI